MESIWNTLCRQRRTIQWVLVAILLTSWHRHSHARTQPRPALLAAIPNAIWRFLPAPPSKDDETSSSGGGGGGGVTATRSASTVCSINTISWDNPVPRGGYRDLHEEANSSSTTVAVNATIVRKKQELQSKHQQHQKTPTTTTTTSDQTSDPQQQQQQPYVFSLFQRGDGHETDVDGIPLRYLNMHNGNRELAKESLASTLSWRTENQIDTLLQRPHEMFDIAKTVFPHYFAGRDQEGHVVFVQRPGLLQMDLAKANGLTKEALLRHYVYVNEYLWQVIESESPLGTMLGIIDLQGINLKTLRQGDIVAFLKIFVQTMDRHYPQRAHKTLLINTPKWFHVVYKLVSPLLRETTKEKIEILSRGKKQDAALFSRMGGEPTATKLLPESFFSKYNHGKNKKEKKHHHQQQQQQRKKLEQQPPQTDLSDDTESMSEEDNNNNDETTLIETASATVQLQQQSELELHLRQFVLERLQDAGKSMTPIIVVATN